MQLLEISLIEAAPASFNEDADIDTLLPGSDGPIRGKAAIGKVFAALL